MNIINKYTIIVAIALLALSISVVPTQHALALTKFFGCITDISKKDGGDHNLTLQQVIDCFKKEFPNNHSSLSQSSLINENHLPSQILNVP